MTRRHAEPPPPDSEIRHEIYRDFRAQFDACEALRRFAFEHSPPSVSLDDRVAFVVGTTFARSLKTYRASVELCRLGYGEQAGMLNRSLFEDMAISYWLRKKKGEVGVDKMLRHNELAVAIYRDALLEHGEQDEAATVPEITAERRTVLEREFGRFGDGTRAQRGGRGARHRDDLGQRDSRRLCPRRRGVGRPGDRGGRGTGFDRIGTRAGAVEAERL